MCIRVACGGECGRICRPPPVTKASPTHRTWRIIRLLACSQLLTVLNEQPASLRVKHPTLLMYIALVWVINGLHNRPDDGKAGRDISCAVLPLTGDFQDPNIALDDDDRQQLMEDLAPGVPYAPGGVLWLRRMLTPPHTTIPRFMIFRPVNESTFQSIFEKSYDRLRHELCPTGFQTQEMLAPDHIPTRKGRTRQREPPPPAEVPRFPVLADIVLEEDSDVDPDVDREMPIPNVADLSAEVHIIWQQFPSDVLQKIGNSRTNRITYSHLSLVDREESGLEVFADLNLGKVFTAVQWKMASWADWQTAFNILFPERSHLTPLNSQHYGQMNYYISWKKLMSKMSEEDAFTTRLQLWCEFKELKWVPAAMQDRVWQYKTAAGWRMLPENAQGGPRVWIHPGGGNVVFERALNVDLREEEEDDESD